MFDITNDTKEERLWSLVNAMELRFLSLYSNANRAEACAFAEKPTYAETYYNRALKDLAEIEDAIKRFRENQPQAYEEGE